MKNVFIMSFVLALACIMAVPFTAAAQNMEAMPFVRIPQDSKAMAMGGAGTAASSAYASYSNSAAIPYSDDTFDATVGYLGWQPSGSPSNMINVAGVYNINGKFGVTVGFMYGMNDSYEVTDDTGYVTGSFSPSEIQANIGFGWRFLPWLSIGANVKYLGNTLAEKTSYGAVASDIFLMSGISDFKVALGVSSLGSKVKSASGATFSLPASVTLGAGYDRVFAEKHGLEVLVDMDCYFSGAFSSSAGAAYTFNDMVSVRGGYHYGGKSVVPSFASVGLGLKFFGVHLDAAYLIASGPLRNTFSIGLGYSF